MRATLDKLQQALERERARSKWDLAAAKKAAVEAKEAAKAQAVEAAAAAEVEALNGGGQGGGGSGGRCGISYHLKLGRHPFHLILVTSAHHTCAKEGRKGYVCGQRKVVHFYVFVSYLATRKVRVCVCLSVCLWVCLLHLCVSCVSLCLRVCLLCASVCLSLCAMRARFCMYVKPDVSGSITSVGFVRQTFGTNLHPQVFGP